MADLQRAPVFTITHQTRNSLSSGYNRSLFTNEQNNDDDFKSQYEILKDSSY